MFIYFREFNFLKATLSFKKFKRIRLSFNSTSHFSKNQDLSLRVVLKMIFDLIKL